jgi:hypothetical protein
MLEKLKQRWNIQSNTQIVIVFIVFAVTGFSVLYAKKLIYLLLGVEPEWAWYIRLVIWLIAILPTYYALLLFWGTVFGQRDFFLWFAKKSFSRFKRKSTKETTSAER